MGWCWWVSILSTIILVPNAIIIGLTLGIVYEKKERELVQGLEILQEKCANSIPTVTDTIILCVYPVCACFFSLLLPSQVKIITPQSVKQSIINQKTHLLLFPTLSQFLPHGLKTPSFVCSRAQSLCKCHVGRSLFFIDFSSSISL